MSWCDPLKVADHRNFCPNIWIACRPLPHVRNGYALFQPPGNPIYARNLLIYPQDQESCHMGELPWTNFPAQSSMASLFFHCRCIVQGFCGFLEAFLLSLCLLLLGYFLHAPAPPWVCVDKCFHLGSNHTDVEGFFPGGPVTGAEIGPLSPHSNDF